MPSPAVRVATPVSVHALDNCRIWLRFDDGVEGEIDLSDLRGRGVFRAWDDESFFRSVRLGSHGAIVWGTEIDLCPDAMYMRLTRKSAEELFPALKSIHADA